MSTGDSLMTGRELLERGRLREARDQFWRDAAEAERQDDGDALAEAALGLGGIWVHEHRSALDRARVSRVQRRALAQLDPGSSLAGRLRARLIAEHAYLTGDNAAILAALSSARSQADPRLLAETLSMAHHCLLGPEDADLRLALADELIALSPTTDRVLDGLMGLAWRTVDLFLAGDRRAAGSLAMLRERLDTDRCDSLRHLVAALDVTLATRAGRLDEAEQLADDCHRLGIDVGDADADGWYGAQLMAIRWLQGRGDELLPLIGALASSPTVTDQNSGGFVAALAVLAASPDNKAASREASTALASLRASGLHNVPSSSIWSATMLGVCEAAHALGDAGAAAEAYELLMPYADRPVMASLAVSCYGSAHRPLGLAAWTSGDLDTAIAHFEAAVAADLAIRNRPWHAVDLAALADALDQRDGPGDRKRAAGSRRAAIEHARRSGMSRRADEWEQRPPPDGGAPVVECRRDGRLWRVQVGGRVVVVPHTIGLEYLAQLIEHAGVEIAAVDLARRSDVERSRVSVHKAVKRALTLITEADPTLGQHISSRVVTGTHCVYLVPTTS
jgi:hypothetical protein